jgi:hypothetical protein
MGSGSPLTECSRQPSNRKRLRQVRRAVQDKRLLRQDLPPPLDETNSGRTRTSPPLLLSFPFILFSFVLSSYYFKARLDEGR